MAPTKTAPRLFTSISGVPIEPLYGPEQLVDFDPARDLGEPGEFPYTRGIHRDMYRGKPWTIRQFSGFATPEETNRRYHYLLEQGQTGLSVAFDWPTLMGYDPDHALSEGEVGKCGASICSLEDMEILFRGIPLNDVTVSMTINSPASVLWAMYLAVAEQQGVDWARLSGTLQNDILKEYIAQKEYIFPPRPSMRLVTDTIEFGARHTPKFNPISISGYHIREAGSTAVQELAFTLRDGIEYVDWALERGLAIDDFAPRLSFFFNAHNYFLEKLTADSEDAANDYIRRIDAMGGMIPAIEAGFPQTEIASASYRYQREVEAGERVIVGVNKFQSDDQPIELLQIDENAGK